MTADIPEYLDWKDLPTLPVDLKKRLCAWANSLEYTSPGDYDAVAGHDFVASLPTDWADHLLALGLRRDDKVLDIGTGTGRARLSMLKGGFTRVVGLDQSSECLAYQAKLQEEMGVPNMGELVRELPPEAAGTFNAVCMSSALHHIADLDGFFLYVSGILAEGGVFVASAEPTNLARFNSLAGLDTRLAIRELVARMESGDRERTLQTTLLAEFHCGDGFSRDALADVMRQHGLELQSWNVYQWLSYLANNYARNALRNADEATLAEYRRHYENLCAADEFIKSSAPQFAADNFFTVIVVARKSAT